jgi:D-beta-D-heptose 7-phosphate kinase/D-beta-D-heptose 1-phosphate adenosyltransferase
MHIDFGRLRVVVVGDFIVDRYIEGAVHRVSPEAPVPVLLSQHERDVLGGAANVVANLAALGAEVEAIGALGDDEAGRRLITLLRDLPGVGVGGLIMDSDRPTTCKMRVVSGRHQIVRIDHEADRPVAGDVEAGLILAIRSAVQNCDVVIVSDYAKGVCSDAVLRAAIEAAAAAAKPCLVDPKRRDFAIYRGATLIKPNRRELADATGLPCQTDLEVELAARRVIERTGSAILLTRSEQGMSYVTADAPPLHIPTAARDVFDVSGAGDTVIAVAALGCADGRPMSEIMRLANVAAGIIVGKVGTTPIDAAELQAALAEEAHHGGLVQGELAQGEPATLKDAVQQREIWRRMGLRVGFTNGCFDLLHPGHVALLRQAARHCDKLIVALNTDASVKRLKGEARPIQDEAARAYVMGALSVVDLVVLFDEDTPARLIEALFPDVLVKGADWAEDQVVGADVVKAAGGKVVRVPLVEGQSTTSIIARSQGSADRTAPDPLAPNPLAPDPLAQALP